jgi:hypothetical protein
MLSSCFLSVSLAGCWMLMNERRLSFTIEANDDGDVAAEQ